MEARAKNILTAAGDKTTADAIVDTFKEIEKNYFLRSWKSSELDSGHFVEAVRRFIDLRLSGSYLPIGKTLASFNDQELKRLASLSGNEAYRLHIPRLMFAIYGLRNKRGVGHLGHVSPNYLDATLILSSSKWILAELIRAESTLSFDETVLLVDRIVERPVVGVWEIGNIRRILVDGLTLKQKVLFLLLAESPQSEEKLRESIAVKESNKRNFRQVLKNLDADNFIELTSNDLCYISPKGFPVAEQIALQHSEAALV